jgi:acetyl-CoA carboxylase biotin carboxyl carrier protein
MNGRQSQDMADRSIEMPVDLAEVHKRAIELLAQLDRAPRNLRIQAGAITVDITWPDEPPAGSHPRQARLDKAGHSGEVTDGEVREYLASPGVGVFYHAREPGAEPFVAVGSIVEPGQQIGIIEAMKLMIPIEADRAGIIAAVLKANGEPVEYGEPLFALEAEELSD